MKLDVGVASGPWGERYFIEGVGSGLFAELLASSAESPEKAKARKKSKRNTSAVVDGALRRLRDLAEHIEPIEVNAHLDGKDISGRYVLFEALNLRYVGPNLHLAHDSNPSDGELDVILVSEAERKRLVYYLDHWQDDRDRLAPGARAKPNEMAGHVEARLDGETVEFLVPTNEKAKAG